MRASGRAKYMGVLLAVGGLFGASTIIFSWQKTWMYLLLYLIGLLLTEWFFKIEIIQELSFLPILAGIMAFHYPVVQASFIMLAVAVTQLILHPKETWRHWLFWLKWVLLIIVMGMINLLTGNVPYGSLSFYTSVIASVASLYGTLLLSSYMVNKKGIEWKNSGIYYISLLSLGVILISFYRLAPFLILACLCIFSVSLHEITRGLQELQKRSDQLAHELKNTLRREIQLAQQIQSKLLNTGVPEFVGGQVAGTSIAACSIGGDYYDFCILKNGKLRIVIGDVMGKGIPAAMLMLLTRSAFRNAAEKGRGPGETLTIMNRILYDDFKALGSFVTVFCADYDPQSKILTYANAGHNLPLIVKGRTRSCEQLPGKGIMLGGMPHQQYQEHSIQLDNDDYVFFYTDGIVEARNEKGEAFRLERLRQILVQYANSPATEIEDQVFQRVTDFTKNLPQKDDITMVVLKVADDNKHLAAV